MATWEKMSSKNLIDLRRTVPQPSPRKEIRTEPERASRRVSPVRSRRRRTRMIVLFICLLAVGVGAYALSWASYLPRYSIGAVSIVGVDKIPPKLIYYYVETQLYTGVHPFLSLDNIFVFNPHALEGSVAHYFPRVASVAISRASLLANAITVTVHERQLFSLWCADEARSECYQMDSGGFIFAPATLPATSVLLSTTTTSATAGFFSQQSQQYVFEGGFASSTDSAHLNPIGQTFIGAHMPGIIALLQRLGQGGFTPLGATVQSAQDLFVPLGQGFYIKVSFGEDPERIVRNLRLALSSDALFGKETQIEYIDVRFGDRLYFKLKGSDESSATSTKSTTQ